MKNIISVATGDMSNNVEIPSVGWMFNYLFAIPSTQENHDHGDYRDNTQVDNLLKMWRELVCERVRYKFYADVLIYRPDGYDRPA